MSVLSTLQSTLNYWVDQVTGTNEKIRQLNKRRNDVESVKNALRSKSDGNAGGVNNRIHTSQDKLTGAIDCSEIGSKLYAIFSGKDERYLGSDSNLTSADSELQRELDDINRQLNDANSALASAKNKVSNTKTDITTEQKKEQDAAVKAAKA